MTFANKYININYKDINNIFPNYDNILHEFKIQKL